MMFDEHVDAAIALFPQKGLGSQRYELAAYLLDITDSRKAFGYWVRDFFHREMVDIRYIFTWRLHSMIDELLGLGVPEDSTVKGRAPAYEETRLILNAAARRVWMEWVRSWAIVQ
jgi:hypothetical protein